LVTGFQEAIAEQGTKPVLGSIDKFGQAFRQAPARILHANGSGDPHLPVGQESILKDEIAGPVEIGGHAPQAQRCAGDRNQGQETGAQRCDAAASGWNPHRHRIGYAFHRTLSNHQVTGGWDLFRRWEEPPERRLQAKLPALQVDQRRLRGYRPYC